MPNERITWSLVDREADALDVSSEARRKWRQTGRGVPLAWRVRIAERLAARGIFVALSDFDALPENPGRVAA